MATRPGGGRMTPENLPPMRGYARQEDRAGQGKGLGDVELRILLK